MSKIKSYLKERERATLAPFLRFSRSKFDGKKLVAWLESQSIQGILPFMK